MPLGLVAWLLKYAVLAGLLCFVAFVVRVMVATLSSSVFPGSEPHLQAPVRRRAPSQHNNKPPTRPSPVRSPQDLPAPKPPLVPSIVLKIVEAGEATVQAGCQFVIKAPGAHIGRAPSNDLVLNDVHVSRHHAYIGRRGNKWVIVDKGSANGTFVNGMQTRGPQVIQPGDVLQIGSVKILVQPSDDDHGAQ